MRVAAALHRLSRDTSAVAFLEFALMFPMFLGFVAAGLEFSNLMLANMRIQRLATMTADMVAQRGASDTQISELQIYDIMSAIDISAEPMNVRERGRIIITAVLGEDTNNDGNADVNTIKWQRFDGAYVAATSSLGCWSSNTAATLRNNRQLTRNEAIFVAQVTYRYEPFFGSTLVDAFDVPTVITRTATFRGRGSVFKPVLSTEGYDPKDNCTSPDGLTH